jgi:hypothetical protein
MYKKQMTLQRITSYLLLVAAALVFVYSLGIMTDLYDSLYYISSIKETSKNYVEGSMIYHEMQPFNRQLTAAGIVLILSALSLFVFRTHDRRKYYIANYITIGINALLNIAVSVWALINVFAYKTQYLQIDFEKLQTVAARYDVTFNQSTFWFDASIAVFGFVFLATALSIANLVFKVILMRAEKKLIEEGKEA